MRAGIFTDAHAGLVDLFPQSIQHTYRPIQLFVHDYNAAFYWDTADTSLIRNG